jgi:hypothetical protein
MFFRIIFGNVSKITELKVKVEIKKVTQQPFNGIIIF